MANANYVGANGPLGANFARRSSAPEHALGETVVGSGDTIWIYVRASGAVATGTCTVNTTTWLVTDAAGNHTADTAFAADEYGWVRQTAKLSA